MNRLLTPRGPRQQKPEGWLDSRRITDSFEFEHHKGSDGDLPERRNLVPPCLAQAMLGRSCKVGGNRRSVDDGCVQKSVNKSYFSMAKSSLKSARGVCGEASRGFFTEDSAHGKGRMTKVKIVPVETTPVVQSRRLADDSVAQKGVEKPLLAAAKSLLESARGVRGEAPRRFFTEDSAHGKARMKKVKIVPVETTPLVQSKRLADGGVAQKGVKKSLFAMAKGSLKSARGVRGEARRVFFTEDTGGKADMDKEEAGTADNTPMLENRHCPAEDRRALLSDCTAVTLLEDEGPCIFARQDAEDSVLVEFEEGSDVQLELSLLPEMGGTDTSGIPTGAKVHALVPCMSSDSALDVLLHSRNPPTVRRLVTLPQAFLRRVPFTFSEMLRDEIFTPLQKNLVRPGDVLVEVNGHKVSNMPFPQVLDLLESPPSYTTTAAAATNCGVKNRRAGQMGQESPSDGVATASPSTEGSSHASSSTMSPAIATTEGKRPRSHAPPATDLARFGYQGDHESSDKFGRALTPTAKSSGEKTLAGRLGDWGKWTPSGKRTQGGIIRSFKRGLSLESFSLKDSGADFMSSQPPSPTTRPSSWRSDEPVTVQPASKTSLRFWIGGREKNQSWLGARTHDRRRAFGLSELVVDEAVETEEEELESIGSRIEGGGKYLNASAFFDSDGEEEEEEEEENEPPRGLEGDLLKCAGGDREGRVSTTRSILGNAGSSVREVNGQEKPCVSTAAVVTAKPSVQHEEDEVIALSRYLACADRGWPWKGKDIVWAEYVALSGRHRWLRSDGFRHALLLVQKTMYLLELPADAAQRHKEYVVSGASVQGGWFLELSANELKFVTIPLSPSETKHSCGVGRTKGGIVFHSRSGGCVWLECTSTGSRDALADAVSAWHSASTEINNPPLDVTRVSNQEAVMVLPRGNSGRHIASLLAERTVHRMW